VLRFNAMAAWWECEFADGSRVGGEHQPALHWLPGGEVRVAARPPPSPPLAASSPSSSPSSSSSRPQQQQQQMIIPVVARHNGEALSFETSSAPGRQQQQGSLFHVELTAAAAAAAPPCAAAAAHLPPPPLRSAADREVAAATEACPRPPAVPPLALALASDTTRLTALCGAVARAVRLHGGNGGGGRRQGSGGPAVLDAGAGGTAALALAAAAAGARTVVAVEAHPQLAAAARACAALNNRACGGRAAAAAAAVRVVHADAARIERGVGGSSGSASDAPAGGFDLVVFDPCAGADPNSGAPLAMLDAIRRRCMAPARDPTVGGAGSAAAAAAAAAAPEPAPLPRVVPAAATVWAVGLEVLSSALVPGGGARPGQQDDDGLGGAPVDLSPLDAFRWRGGAACSAEGEAGLPPPCRGALAAEAGWDPVDLASLPHVRLTRPARVLTMDFEAALGRAGAGAAAAAAAAAAEAAAVGGGLSPPHHAALRVVRGGTLNAVAYWAEMHLPPFGQDGRPSSYSMGPPRSYYRSLCAGAAAVAPGGGGGGGGGSGDGGGRGGGGGGSGDDDKDEDEDGSSGPGTDPRGQALQYLETWAEAVRPGDLAHLDARLGARCVRFRLLGVAGRAGDDGGSGGGGGGGGGLDGQIRLLRPALRAPWLAPNAGIENPDVWAVRRCHEVLAQALQRAGRAEPGASAAAASAAASCGGAGAGAAAVVAAGRRRRLPAVWRDFFVLLRHCASLGLDPAVLAQTAQAVALAEELAGLLSGSGGEGSGGGGGGFARAASALVAPDVLGARGCAWR